jgi:hypothetical protein
MSSVSASTNSPPPFVGITHVPSGWFWAVWPSQDEFYQRLRHGMLPDRFGVERTRYAARRAAEMAAGGSPEFVFRPWIARSAYQAVTGDAQESTEQVGSEVAKRVCEATAAKFAAIKAKFECCREYPHVAASLMTWALPTDRQLPSRLLGQSLRAIVDESFVELANTRGVGPTRLHGLLTVLDRAVQALVSLPHQCPTSDSDELGRESRSSLPNESPVRREDRPRPWRTVASTWPWRHGESGNEGPWQSVCERVQRFGVESDDLVYWGLCWKAAVERIHGHRLNSYPLGRFARSLRQLPRRLWSQPVSSFIDVSLADVLQLSGYGIKTPGEIVDVVIHLNEFLADIPRDSLVHKPVLPSRISAAADWLGRALATSDVPDLGDLRQHLVRPVLEQLRTDLPSEVSNMVEQRLGLDGAPQTFSKIAEAFRRTPERIRQQTRRACGVFLVRWPEGKDLLYEFVNRFRDTPDASGQVELTQRCVDLLYGPLPCRLPQRAG